MYTFIVTTKMSWWNNTKRSTFCLIYMLLVRDVCWLLLCTGTATCAVCQGQCNGIRVDVDTVMSSLEYSMRCGNHTNTRCSWMRPTLLLCGSSIKLMCPIRQSHAGTVSQCSIVAVVSHCIPWPSTYAQALLPQVLFWDQNLKMPLSDHEKRVDWSWQHAYSMIEVQTTLKGELLSIRQDLKWPAHL
jgi:hypothetical protein